MTKLVIDESQSLVLSNWLDGHAVITSELALTEVPRAVRRSIGTDISLLGPALSVAEELLRSIDLAGLRREVLALAGALVEPTLRTLDAIHVATARVALPVIDTFVSYDRRQLLAASAAGLATHSPGA